MTHDKPAFPTVEFYDERPIDMHPGMTLRDWFAGQALLGVIARGVKSPAAEVAEAAYEYADAMLEARQ
ncbi:MAG TPA: hypothetical protein VKB41_06755 [Steroidobacteraceae bacterium]|nr:hypothetical protein [Steroidobacteraceae bacterium]